MKEYIKYIKSLNIKELNESIDKFEYNQISFDEFQFNVINNGEISLNVFEKEKKIKNLLNEKESQ